MQSYTTQEIEDLFTFTTTQASKKSPKPKAPKNLDQKQATYAVKCNATQRVYIGSGIMSSKSSKSSKTGTVNRLSYHRTLLSKNKHPIALMQQDWDQYSDSFEFLILKECTAKDARQEEQIQIIKIKTFSQKWKLYNVKNAFKF